jgi:small subunit ribosomal protein S1
MRDWRKNQKDRLLTTLNKGDVLKGIVTSIADFGAFVDLGGADGLIHLSELAWHRVEHPREILKVGQEVEVYVMNVDEERKRIGLSLRRLSPEPWSVVADRYQVGQVVTATVTRLAAFGAFAKMDDAIEGLIHISEMADYRINHPKEIVQEGDVVQVRVIRIDPQHRRIGLSLRQASDDNYVDWAADSAVADAVDDGDMIEGMAAEALSVEQM